MPLSTRESLLLKLKQTSEHTSCNQDAWFEFVELYGPVVYGRCLRAGLQSADAQSVTQDVFVRVYRAIGRFEYDRARGQFRSWLYRITRNEIRRMITRGQKRANAVGGGLADHLLDLSSENAGSEWDDEINRRIYELASERIKEDFPDEFAVFQKIWEDSRPPADIAMEYGKTRAWVYQVKYRVLRRLEAEVQRLSEDQFPFPNTPPKDES